MPYKDPQVQSDWQNKRRRRKVEFIWSLKNKPCQDCGGSFHPAVMQWDHTRDKFRDISKMVLYSKEKILKEIAKCELVCANCHAMRTFKRNDNHAAGWSNGNL